MTTLAIGQLLRKRREAFGASLEEAARWCNVTPAWLKEQEAKEDLAVTDFERICRGLAVFPAELLREESDLPTRSVARFRSALSSYPQKAKSRSGRKAPVNSLSPSDLRLLATAAEIGRTLAALLAMQDKDLPFDAYYNRVGLSTKKEPWKHGYELGENARSKLIPETGPIYELESALTGIGVHVIRAEFSTPGVVIEAASVWESNAVPIIIVNPSRKGGYLMSRRASLAHELCHLLHDGGKNDLVTMVSFKGGGSYEEDVEKRARGFSPAFLAPRIQVREWWDMGCYSSQDPEEAVLALAQHWGLSFEGATWHAKNCDLIGDEVAEALRKRNKHQQPSTGQFEKESDSSSLQRCYPELVNDASEFMKGYGARLIAEALDGSFISLARAKELLAWR